MTSDANGLASWETTGGGWYVPTSVKTTTATHNGNFGGYQAMYTWIQSNGCSGYHVCSGTDLAAYFQFHPQTLDLLPSGWYNSGYRDGVSGPSHDCEGWRVTSDYGPAWYRNVEAYGSACSSSLPVMCCK